MSQAPRSGRVRVFIASSLDGFIAGEDDDLSWLPEPGSDEAESQASGALGFEGFFSDVGAMLMGRRTYDVVCGFEDWFYGDTPVLVATTRPLPQHPRHPEANIRAAVGTSIQELVSDALTAARGRDVYLDGGQLIRQALEAKLVDELIVTLIPVILGRGIPLFAGADQRHSLNLTAANQAGSGMVELRYEQYDTARGGPWCCPYPTHSHTWGSGSSTLFHP